MENLHLLLLRISRSWMGCSMNQKLPIKLPGTWLHFPQRSSKQNKGEKKVQWRPRLFSCVARRPPEVRLREHRDTLCKGGCGLQSAAQPLRGCHRKTPSLALNRLEWQSARSSPAPGGFRRALPSPCQTSGGADTRDPERRAAPAPIPGPRWALCRCRRTYRGPQKHATPASLANLPSKADKGAGEELAARGVRECPQPELGTRSWGSPVAPKARLRCPPTQLRGQAPLTDAELLRRRLAGSRLPRDHGDPRVRSPSVGWDPSTSLGGGRRRQLRASPGGGRSLAAAGARPRAARELGPHGPAG